MKKRIVITYDDSGAMLPWSLAAALERIGHEIAGRGATDGDAKYGEVELSWDVNEVQGREKP
jgi:hypothetical protein